MNRVIVFRLVIAAVGFCLILASPTGVRAYDFTGPHTLNPDPISEPTPDGTPVVAAGKQTPGVWVAFYEVSNFIARTRSTDGGKTWSSPFFIEEKQGGVHFQASVASDSNGVMVAAWHLGYAGIRVTRSTNQGLTWSAPINLPGKIGAAEYYPKVSADDNGTFIIMNEIHLAPGNSDYDIGVRRSTDSGATWSNQQMINESMSEDSLNDVGVGLAGANGTWVAVFNTENTFGTLSPANVLRMVTCRSTDNGATWSNMTPVIETPVAPAGWPGYWPSIVTDTKGNYVIAQNYHTAGGAVDYDIHSFTSTDDGQSWTGPSFVNANALTDIFDHRYPYLATTGDGHFLCAFESDEPLAGNVPGDIDVFYAESTDLGATWSPIRRVLASMEDDTSVDHTYRCSAECDKLGNYMVSWFSNGRFGADNDAMVAIANAGGDVSVSKQDSADPVGINQEFTYRIRIKNLGYNAANPVTLVDTIPPEVAYITSAITSGTCVLVGDTLTCDLGQLLPQQTAILTILVKALVPGIATNVVSVFSPSDANLENNTDAEDTRILTAGESTDLTGSWVSASVSCRGQGRRQRCTIKGTFMPANIGSKTSGKCWLRFYLSEDTVYDPSDVLLNKKLYGSLKGITQITYKLNAPVSSTLSPAGKYVIAVIDEENQTGETDESNNQLASPRL